MNTYEKIKQLCDSMNKCCTLTEEQTIIIMGVDDKTMNVFQFAHGSSLSCIAAIGCLVDSLAKKQTIFSRDDIIRIISNGGDI